MTLSSFSRIVAIVLVGLSLSGCQHFATIVLNLPYFQPGYGYGGGRAVNHAPPPRVVYVQPAPRRHCCY